MSKDQKNRAMDLAIDSHPTTKKFLEEKTAAERVVQLNPAEQLRLNKNTVSDADQVNFNVPHLMLRFLCLHYFVYSCYKNFLLLQIGKFEFLFFRGRPLQETWTSTGISESTWMKWHESTSSNGGRPELKNGRVL